MSGVSGYPAAVGGAYLPILPWDTFTPDLTQGGASKAIKENASQYASIGNVIFASYYFRMDTHASSSSEVRISLPVATTFEGVAGFMFWLTDLGSPGAILETVAEVENGTLRLMVTGDNPAGYLAEELAADWGFAGMISYGA